MRRRSTNAWGPEIQLHHPLSVPTSVQRVAEHPGNRRRRRIRRRRRSVPSDRRILVLHRGHGRVAELVTRGLSCVCGRTISACRSSLRLRPRRPELSVCRTESTTTTRVGRSLERTERSDESAHWRPATTTTRAWFRAVQSANILLPLALTFHCGDLRISANNSSQLARYWK